jgi:hypothetical protein
MEGENENSRNPGQHLSARKGPDFFGMESWRLQLPKIHLIGGDAMALNAVRTGDRYFQMSQSY